MPEQPRVSVIMATYDMGQYVPQAVESVLSQGYENLELIVVDDGSHDDTQERLKPYAGDPRVKCILQDNAGQTVAKNRGLKEATGDYIGFCDSDNRWRPGKLAKQLAVFAENPEIGVVYGDIVLIGSDGQSLPPQPIKRYSGRITGKLLLDNFVAFNTTLTPHRIIREMGGFDEKLRMGIDYDLWLRISTKYPFHYLPEDLVDYRIWGGQMSHRTGERMENFFRLLENFLAANPGAVTRAQARHAWAHSYTTRGRWLSRVGRRSDAMADYQKALEYRPHDLRTWKSLTRLVLGMKS